jgi:hypothetical protein
VIGYDERRSVNARRSDSRHRLARPAAASGRLRLLLLALRLGALPPAAPRTVQALAQGAATVREAGRLRA